MSRIIVQAIRRLHCSREKSWNRYFVCGCNWFCLRSIHLKRTEEIKEKLGGKIAMKQLIILSQEDVTDTIQSHCNYSKTRRVIGGSKH